LNNFVKLPLRCPRGDHGVNVNTLDFTKSTNYHHHPETINLEELEQSKRNLHSIVEKNRGVIGGLEA